ncbi:MAG: DUF21 domain-containing protein [Gammaproteobacteria bacterium]|nr:DUF21 domain-containing protein [Gammaproteobacteria bacterium]
MDTAPTLELLLTLLGLLIVIAFSSGTEVAMLSVNRYRVRTRAASGERRARALEKLLAKPDQWLGANLVILALASVAASTVATLLALRVPHPQALPVMMFALTVFIIIFCELAPKIYAAVHSESVALNSTLIYRVLLWLTWPALWFTNRAAYGFLRLFGLHGATRGAQALSAEELRTVVSESSALIPARHRQMLLSILDLERITVNDIMIPRQDIAGIDISSDWEDVLERLRQTPHTRLPVYDGELDNLIGILHMKRTAQEFARATLTRERLIELAQAREPYFVPEGTSLMHQLAQFQRNRRRHAFVVNEYGDIEGMVTLEDLLEEIVGEFTTDPATVGHKDVHRDASGAWLVNASATIRALNRALGWQLPDLGPKTLNGLLLEKFENIPQAGTSLRIGALEFEVLQTADNSIRTVRVRPIV